MLPEDNAAFNNPNPSGPAFKMSFANTANIATAPPKRTAIISSVKAPKITLSLNTNFNPTFKLSFTDSLVFLFMIGFLSICITSNNANSTSKNIMPNVALIPIQAIKTPPKRAPNTAAPFHVLLLHVAAFGYAFLGTNRAISEKIVGPKKALNTPPKNTRL